MYQVLKAEEEIGFFLPCDVVVYEKEGKTIVSALNPMVMPPLTDDQTLREVATQVKERQERVIKNV